MDNDYSQRSNPFDLDIEMDTEASVISPPLTYSNDYLSPVPAEAILNTSSNGPTGLDYSNIGSGVSSGMPRRSPSLLSPPRNFQHLSPHNFLHPSYSQDDQFSQSNSFSEQQELLPSPITAGQDFTYTGDDTGSVNHYISPQRNNRTISSLMASPLSDAQGPSYEAPNSYFPVYENTTELYRRREGYDEVPITPPENWSYGPSSSNRNLTAVGATVSAIPPQPMGQMSHFANTDEVPPSSTMGSRHCHTCNPPRFFENPNRYFLHYWGEHPPLPTSSQAWRPRLCLWDTCTLRKEFRTYKSWLDHAFTVHFRRFRCTYDGCDFPKAFGSQNTLSRHIRTIHEPPELCTIPGCQGSRNKLSRKDKRDGHKASFHGPLVCEVAGCLRGRIDDQDHGFTEPEELAKHMKSKHKYLRS